MYVNINIYFWNWLWVYVVYINGGYNLNIKDRLKNYNKSKSDIEILNSEIEILKLQEELFDEAAETLKATSYEEGMPLHFGNEFNSKTENIAIRRENYLINIKRLELKLLELTENVVIVESKLRILDNHEKFIITKKYFDNLKYNWEIREAYKKEFLRYISDTTFARKLNSALRKMWIP